MLPTATPPDPALPASLDLFPLHVSCTPAASAPHTTRTVPIDPRRIVCAGEAIALPPWTRIVSEAKPGAAMLRISEPKDIVPMMADFLYAEHESFIVFTLDTRSRVIRRHEVTRGLLDSSLVHPRECFRRAIADAAAGIIVAHNHPSGDPTPSAEDRAVTRQLVAAGQLLDIPVYDHIIVAGERFLSFATAGLL